MQFDLFYFRKNLLNYYLIHYYYFKIQQFFVNEQILSIKKKRYPFYQKIIVFGPINRKLCTN